MKWIPIVLLAAAALGACSPTGPAGGPASPEAKVIAHSAKNVQEYMPLAKGNSWTYQVTGFQQTRGKPQTGGTNETAMKVTELKDTTTGKRAIVSLYEGAKVRSKVGFMTNDKGVYQTGAFGDKVRAEYSPPMPMVLLPAKPGQKFTWKGVGVLPGVDGSGPLTSEMTFKGESVVDTEAGRMKAVRFDAVLKYTVKGKAYEVGQSTWFVPKVGLVRSIEIIKAPDFVRSIELKLKSYTVK